LILPLIFGLLAIIFGTIAPKHAGGKWQGMAIAGLTLGIVDLVLMGILAILYY
jgi:hypothetical protein